jgi:hypothetical protein
MQLKRLMWPGKNIILEDIGALALFAFRDSFNLCRSTVKMLLHMLYGVLRMYDVVLRANPNDMLLFLSRIHRHLKLPNMVKVRNQNHAKPGQVIALT